nr:AMP-binding protein [Allomuricauda sp.]
MRESPVWRNIHKEFRLNGVHYAFDELNEIGYSLIKEGEEFEIAMGDFILDWISDAPTLAAQTSGSTGTPKTILLQKSHMVNSALATGAYFSLSSGDSALLCLPSSGIAGKMMLVRAMVLGLNLDYEGPSSQPLSHQGKSYHFVAMVPLQLENSLNKLTNIKTLIVGGAPVSTSLKKQLHGLSTSVYETYGMTETITHIAVKQLNGKEEEVFTALPDVHISQDERNCLVIEASHISNSKIITNDIVELVRESQFKWLGRYDSIINSGGVKLFPEQIEQKISEIIEDRFFVYGIPDEQLGERLVLLIESENRDTSRLKEKIKNLTTLSKYEIPKEIFFMSNFEETQTGKILRSETIKKIT